MHEYLTDSNVDWGQQLKSVSKYLKERNVKECWFAYFADGVVDTHYYGIPCHSMVTADTLWVGQETPTPLEIDGPVLVSVSDLNSYEMGDSYLNPYKQFQTMQPTAIIDRGVYVFDGHFRVATASAMAHTQVVWRLMGEGKLPEALAEAQAAVAADSGCIMAQMALGDVLAAMGRREEARTAYTAAWQDAMNLQPGPRRGQLEDIRGRLARLK